MTSRHVGKNKSGHYVLGRASFMAVTAVEGLVLTPAGKARREAADASGLSQEERRRQIREAYSAKAKR
jgi:hypothetical protein